MELAEALFNSLPNRNKNHFGDLTKSHLFLPALQNDTITKTLHTEPLFRRYEGEQRFKHIFAYKRELGDGLKSLRIAQRPLLKIIEELDGFLMYMRNTGRAMNFKLPEEPPVKKDPSCPKSYIDHLTYVNSDDIFPLPDFTDVLAGVSDSLSDEDSTVRDSQELAAE